MLRMIVDYLWILMQIIKDVFNVPKISITHFRPKLKLQSFAVARLCDMHVCMCMFICIMYIYISGGPLSALTCCVNVRLLSAIKKISPLIYSQSWVGSWVYTTQAMMTFTLIF